MKLETKGGTETDTKVIILYTAHTPNFLKQFKGFIETTKPNLIILEEDKKATFQQMLEGKITVKQYMQGYIYPMPQFIEKRYEFLVKLHKEKPEIRIEQFEPSIEMELRNMIRNQISMEIGLSVAKGDFEGGVKGMINFAKSEADWLKVEEEMRAKGIAEKIKNGEWKGRILVEAGATHTRVGHFLKKYLNDVEVSSIYLFKETIQEALKDEVYGSQLHMLYPPPQELKRLYISGRKVSEEREKLLGARALVLSMITSKNEGELGNVDTIKKIQMVNRLNYEECRDLFNEITSKELGVSEFKKFKPM
ncbi:MAG: hypothetical protein QXF56_03200 [Candidatus Micrarchaeia archaeon]